MSVLSDSALAALFPGYHGAIGPASVDLHLGDTLLWWPDWLRRNPRIDQHAIWKPVTLTSEVWVLRPGVRYLAATRERIAIPVNLAGQIAARSSWGRDGLSVIQGPAGWIDPGFIGHPTLELSVIGSDLEVWPGAAICQLVLHTLSSACERPYSGKYQSDAAPTPSRLWKETVS